MSARPRLPVAPPRAREKIRFPPELPISAKVPEIIDTLSKHQVVIVAGATGSGKTTQLPKIALEMGRGGRRQIGVTQPRRIAATSVAARVANELKCTLGNEVGYQIRFEDRSSENTWIKFMTDGILLAEIQSDRNLKGYDTLIIDEAHERSLTIDFLLGWLKNILPKRPDLKVIISSATIETDRFSEFFNGAPVIQVEGRTYPVEVLYEPPDPELDLPEAVANAVANVTSLDPHGDILVFLPGEREIRETEQALNRQNLRHTQILPLYARLSAADQAKAFASIPKRRVILATNVAETSLTLPGIVYVIDTGVARIIRYDSKTGTTRLQIEGISQASVDQRKGRCGRVREGICIRLYDETSFLARAAFTDPEIKRTGLAGVILRMKALELGEVESFPFLDPPRSGAITEGYRVLEELGALDAERRLTELGRQLAQFPVDPRIARMILASVSLGCLAEVLVVASALGLQDPRERPHGLEPKADGLHRRFVDERSDFLGILRLFNFVRPAFLQSLSQLRKLCKENFLSFVRVREWFELHQRLEELAREHHLPDAPKRKSIPPKSASPENSDALHQALLAGLLSRIGLYQSEHRAYQGARQTRFVLHPSSGLAKSPPAWVMAYELVQTSQMFARVAAKIEPSWLDQLGSHLMTRKYSDPHWSEKSARASVREHATLFGLPVLKDRSVDYATIAPEAARKMFLEHALVRGEYRSRGAFQEHNRNLFDEIARLRDKARQSDLLFDDSRLLAFFDQRVPPKVVNGKTFEAWRESAERENPRLLYLSFADVFSGDERLDPSQYPDEIEISGVKISISYVFDPTADDDGITLYVPLSVLPQLEPDSLDHTIPAWHERKIAAIIEELPRITRQKLGRTSELIPKLVELVPNGQGAFLTALSQALFDATGVRVASDTLPIETIPAYLRFNYRITGERNLVIAESRHLSDLMKHYGVKARALLEQEKPPEQWCRKGLTRFDVDELPEFVTRTVQGVNIRTYPALLDRNTSVELTLLESGESAEREHRNGVRRLLILGNQNALQNLSKRIGAPLPRRTLLPPSRTEIDRFRQLFVNRVVNEAFCLHDDVALPRTKVAFERMQTDGVARLAPVFETTLKTLATTTLEYEKLLRALEQAAKVPSALAAAADIKTELEHLLFEDFLAHVDLIRFGHYPRYLRAAQARLARAIVDPRKDATKAAPFKPLWQQYVSLQSKVVDQKRLQRVRFSLAELRVTLFAPELKAAESVSTESVQRLLTELR